MAWVVSRALGFVALVVTPTPDGRWFNAFGVTAMDGGWYRIIVTQGYPNWSATTVGTAWPFFPLYPWLADMLTRLGMPVGPALIGVSWFFALVAFGGMWQLAAGRFDDRVAALSVWVLALLPGSIGLVLAYSDSLFVAALVWMLVLIDRRAQAVQDAAVLSRWTWWQVGALAAIGTASRPNGFMLVAVAWAAAWCIDRRWRHAAAAAVPSLMFLVSWMIYGQRKVGDPLIFLTAKAAWNESPLWKFLVHPFAREAVPFHVVVGLAVLALAAPSLRKLPSWWLVCIVVLVLPQMVLGLEGLARYVTLAAPLSIACALTLSRRPRWVQWLVLLVCAAGLMFLGVWVVRYSWVP